MSVTVLGIDPSLSNTGLCWGNDESADHNKRCLTYKPAKGECADVVGRIGRLNALISEVDFWLKDIMPDVVMIEGYAYGKTSGGEMLAEFGGMLRCRLFTSTPDIKEVTPGQLKKFAIGKGVGKKEQILLQVYKRWGVECANADEADAYVLYRIGLCYAGICESENAAQASVVDGLKGVE